MKESELNILNDLAQRIYDLSLDNFDIEVLYSKTKESQKKIELETSTLVFNEKDETGKKKYSNTEQRQTEVDKILADNLSYQRGEMNLLNYNLKIGKDKIELQYLRDRLENYRLYFQNKENIVNNVMCGCADTNIKNT
jgi:hypothetical protein